MTDRPFREIRDSYFVATDLATGGNWVRKGVLPLFTSEAAFAAHAATPGFPDGKGVRRVEGWEGILAVLESARSAGAEWIAIDPTHRAAGLCLDEAIEHTREMLTGKFDIPIVDHSSN